MILSEERQLHWSHLVTDCLWNDDLVDFTDDDMALRAARKALAAFVEQQGDIEVIVSQKIRSLKRQVVEGSSEWEILYQKYFEEELARHGNK